MYCCNALSKDFALLTEDRKGKKFVKFVETDAALKAGQRVDPDSETQICAIDAGKEAATRREAREKKCCRGLLAGLEAVLEAIAPAASRRFSLQLQG